MYQNCKRIKKSSSKELEDNPIDLIHQLKQITDMHYSESAKQDVKITKTTPILIKEPHGIYKGLTSSKSATGHKMILRSKGKKNIKDLFSSCANTKSFTNIKLQLELNKNTKDIVKITAKKPPLVLHRKSTPGFKLKSNKLSHKKIAECLNGIRRKGRNIELERSSKNVFGSNIPQIPKYFSLKRLYRHLDPTQSSLDSNLTTSVNIRSACF